MLKQEIIGLHTCRTLRWDEENDEIINYLLNPFN